MIGSGIKANILLQRIFLSKIISDILKQFINLRKVGFTFDLYGIIKIYTISIHKTCSDASRKDVNSNWYYLIKFMK